MIGAVLTLVSALCGGLAVRFLTGHTLTGTKLSLASILLNAFTTGIFLGIALLHMLMEALRAADMIMALSLVGTAIILSFLLQQFLESTHSHRMLTSEDDSIELNPVGGGSRKSTPIAESMKGQPMKALLFVVLSFHSVLTGLAIGSGFSHSISGLSSTVAVVAFHKCFEGIALANSFKDFISPSLEPRNTCSKFLGIFLTFAMMTPLGILIGIALSDVNPAGSSIGAALLSLSAGSFLSVIALELFPSLLKESKSSTTKVLVSCTMLCGYLLMIILSFV